MTANKIFLAYLKEMKLPQPEQEYKFHDTRRWKFDYAWPSSKVALEVEGGIYIQGRHSRGAGMEKDFQKYNTAAVLGWRVLKVVPRKLCTAETIEMIKQIIT